MSPSNTIRITAARTFRSLRIRNYRLFSAGQLVSVTGTWMQTVAQGWLVLDLTGSGTALGASVGLQFLPQLVLGMWGGLIADRFDKRKLLLATQTSSAVLAITLWALVGSGTVTLAMVYALVFVSGCVHMIDMPTRQAFVTEMVGPAEVPNAVALNSALFNTGRLAGPALAGIVIASMGVAAAFLINAVSYAGVLAALASMRPGELFHNTRAERERRQVRAGLRYVWTTPILRSTLLLVAAVGTFGMNFVVVLPLLARYELGGGAALYGTLTSLMAIGSVVGALGMAGAGRPSRRLLVGAAGSFGAFSMMAAVGPNSLVVGAVLVGVGLASIMFLATANATLQLNSDPLMRGRVMALYGLVFLGSTPVGGPLMGWMAERWGSRFALASGGAACVAAALAFLTSAARRRWLSYRRAGTASAGGVAAAA